MAVRGDHCFTLFLSHLRDTDVQNSHMSYKKKAWSLKVYHRAMAFPFFNACTCKNKDSHSLTRISDLNVSNAKYPRAALGSTCTEQAGSEWPPSHCKKAHADCYLHEIHHRGT